MKKLITILTFVLFALAASAALQVDIVTIKAQPASADLLIEYQIRDDQDTETTADDVVTRHGETVVLEGYSPTTNTTDIKAAATTDAITKELVPNPE